MKTKIIIFSLLLLCSCSIRRQVEQTQHSSTYDSAVVKVVERIDSVYVDRWHSTTTNGDTVYRVDSVVYYRYLYRTNTDTMIVAKTDTLYRYAATTKEVRKPNRFTACCTLLYFLTLVAIAVIIWRRYIKL